MTRPFPIHNTVETFGGNSSLTLTTPTLFYSLSLGFFNRISDYTHLSKPININKNDDC
ncbi:hypothetical protein BC941DRAFT_519540 [Chlamydoabsidia padenii]|nr:hypothetical protein BC941DRAFT_519540 [Chlamydoabsidia padenii]